MTEFEERKDKVLAALKGLDKTVYAAFNQVKKLAGKNSANYAYAIVDQTGEGRTVACPDYKTWEEEVSQVRKTIKPYKGNILVQGTLLKDYVAQVETEEREHSPEVNIQVLMPGQIYFRQLKKLLG